jgi:hypothetical protein
MLDSDLDRSKKTLSSISQVATREFDRESIACPRVTRQCF